MPYRCSAEVARRSPRGWPSAGKSPPSPALAGDEVAARAPERLQGAGLDDDRQVQDPRLELLEGIAAHYRVAGDAALAAAGGHLADDLALESLVVELALAGHHERGRAHALVEADRVEHVRRAGEQLRSPERPEAAGQAARGACHGLATGVARGAAGQLVEPPLE